MWYLSGIFALCLTAHSLTGCALKPLRFVDGVDGSSPLLDGNTPNDQEPPDGTLTLDTPNADAFESATDAVSDRPNVIVDGAVPVRPSCTNNAHPQDCRVVAIAPSDSFCIGTNDPMRASPDNTPALCGLRLSAFAMDATEVSIARFARFREEWAAGRLPPTMDVRYPNGVVLRATLPSIGDTTQQAVGVGCNFRFNNPALRSEHPMNCVAPNLAQYFCAWDHGRLPTNTEYEYVVRWWGGSAAAGRTYPWGETDPTCMHANFSGCPGDDGAQTKRIGTTALGAILGQIFDLGGNVGEWLADDYATYASLAMMPCWTRSPNNPLCPTMAGAIASNRGGGFSNPAPALNTIIRGRDTGGAEPNKGWRCVYSL